LILAFSELTKVFLESNYVSSKFVFNKLFKIYISFFYW